MNGEEGKAKEQCGNRRFGRVLVAQYSNLAELQFDDDIEAPYRASAHSVTSISCLQLAAVLESRCPPS